MKSKFILLILFSFVLFGCGDNQGKETKTEAGKENEKETVVIFEDKKLETIVREELKITDEDITSKDMLELKTIRIKDSGVKNLSGLEYAKNLNDISIFEEEIKSLDPISKINNLKRITISYSKIESLPIKFDKEVQLIDLTIIDTLINDVSFVKEMVSLETISLPSCGITNIDSFKKLNNLVYLGMNDNKIENIKSLSGKNKLKDLDLQGNSVNDIGPLKNLSSLSELVLSYNPITNLTPLYNLPNLKTLTIYQNHDVKHLIFEQVDKLTASGVEVLHHR